MITDYFTIITIPELICFITAAVCLYSDKSPAWKWLVFYLLLVCVAEFSGIYIKNHDKKNSWVYNILLIFETPTMLLMFRETLNRYINSNLLIIIAAAILIVTYGLETTLHDGGIYKRDLYTNTVLAVVASLLSLYYFYWFLKDDAYMPILSAADVWWIFGTFLFYFTVTVTYVFYVSLTALFIKQNTAIVYIYKAVNAAQYVCWSYSFI